MKALLQSSGTAGKHLSVPLYVDWKRLRGSEMFQTLWNPTHLPKAKLYIHTDNATDLATDFIHLDNGCCLKQGDTTLLTPSLYHSQTTYFFPAIHLLSVETWSFLKYKPPFFRHRVVTNMFLHVDSMRQYRGIKASKLLWQLLRQYMCKMFILQKTNLHSCAIPVSIVFNLYIIIKNLLTYAYLLKRGVALPRNQQ